jgi:hypothetical protein
MPELAITLNERKASTEQSSMNTANSTQSGFQSMMAKRSGMQNWNNLRTLLSSGSNREAAAIVESFQLQLEFEELEFYTDAA